MASLDIYDPAFLRDPYSIYRLLQRDEPVARTATGDWLLTRYRDVQDVLRDPRFAVDPARLNRRNRRRRPDRNSPLRQASGTNILLFQDPPDHTRVRALVSQAFNPRRAASLEPRVEQIVSDLLDRVEERGGPFDMLADLGVPLPVHVVCDLLGVPFEDQAWFGKLAPAMARMVDGNQDRYELAEGMAASVQLVQYFNDLFEKRRVEPRDDLLTALVEAEEEGETLTAAELRLVSVFVFFAGYETTTNLMGNGLYALLQHPDQLELLRSDPSVRKNAVEELLRYDAPVHATIRIPTESVEVAGHTIPPGESVICILGAANRDPEVFEDPDRLDITRPNANRHLAFSQGIHYCIGAALARIEGQVLFGRLLERFDDLRLVEEPEYRPTTVLRGLKRLLVEPVTR